eukprot:scaffold152798_cov20-Tisochrysis_lutea.AAC.2
MHARKCAHTHSHTGSYASPATTLLLISLIQKLAAYTSAAARLLPPATSRPTGSQGHAPWVVSLTGHDFAFESGPHSLCHSRGRGCCCCLVLWASRGLRSGHAGLGTGQHGLRTDQRLQRTSRDLHARTGVCVYVLVCMYV